MRFIQILSSESSLTALDTDGNVFVYLGQKFGWARLNMTRLSDEEAAKVRKLKFDKRFDGNDYAGDVHTYDSGYRR